MLHHSVLQNILMRLQCNVSCHRCFSSLRTKQVKRWKYLTMLHHRAIIFNHGYSLQCKHSSCSLVDQGLLQNTVNGQLELLSIITCRRNIYNSSGRPSDKNNKTSDEDHNKSNNFPSQTQLLFIIIANAVIGAMILLDQRLRPREMSISWEQFRQEILPSGEVKHATVLRDKPSKALIYLHHGASFGNKQMGLLLVSVKDGESFQMKLREEEKKLGINPSHYINISQAPVPMESLSALQIVMGFSLLTMSVIGIVLYRRRRTSTKTFFYTSKQAKKPKDDPFSQFNIFKMFDTNVDFVKNTSVKFDDVAGMHEAKQEVMEFVQFLKSPEHYKRLGAKMPLGCLLTGPPGVGKTMLAKAVASEAGVPFIAKAGSDFVEMIGGLGARRIRQLFEKARGSSPCIVYIDELDAVGGARSKTHQLGTGASEKDQTLNQILVEMDGMLSRQHQVIVLASTNRADILDKALLRPGRFDRIVHIDLPNRKERKEILEKHLQHIKLSGEPSDFSDQLASETPGMSGADLANICNEAAIYAARENDDVVERRHLDYALERVTSGAPKSTTSLSPEERRKVAVHESGHALVGWLLEHTNALAKITIIPHTKGLLGVTRTIPSDRYLHSQEQLFDNMCMALGGRAAESLLFGNVTHGAQDDLERVTKMAYAQVKEFGFNSTVGPLSYQEEGNLQTRPYSEALATIIDAEVKKLVTKAYDRTKKLLEEHKAMLQKVSDELLSRETLTYQDVVNLIGPPSYGHKRQISSLPTDEQTDDTEDVATEKNVDTLK